MVRNLSLSSRNILGEITDVVKGISTRISEIVSEWNTELYPLLSTLPQGTLDPRFPNAISPPNPKRNGFDGSNIYVDNSATSTSGGGKFWDLARLRPITVKESIDNLYSSISSQIALLQAGVAQTTSGLSETMKKKIGYNIFDGSQISSATSLDGLSQSHSRHLLQLARDLYDDLYDTWTTDGSASLTYSVRDQVNSLLTIHGTAWQSSTVPKHEAASDTPLSISEEGTVIENNTTSMDFIGTSLLVESIADHLISITDRGTLPGINNILYVDEGSNTDENGTIDAPFQSLENAIDAAVALEPTESNPLIIYLYPGIYSIPAKSLADGIWIVGAEKDTTVFSMTGELQIPASATCGFINLCISCSLSPSISTQGDSITFSNCSILGDIETSGTGGTVTLDSQTSMIGKITAGADNSNLFLRNIRGQGGINYFLVLGSTSVTTIIEKSFLIGEATSEAIYWDTQNNLLRIKYSTILHGAGGTNHPFERSGTFDPLFRSHHSAYTLDYEASGVWINQIAPGQRFDTLDVGANY